MIVYLSPFENSDKNYSTFNNIATFLRGVLDSEATQIVCDGFFSSVDYTDLQSVLPMICKKLRLDGELIVKDLDASLVAHQIFKNEVPLKEMNEKVIKSRTIKCLMSSDDVERAIAGSVQITAKHFDDSMCEFIIKAKRSR